MEPNRTNSARAKGLQHVAVAPGVGFGEEGDGFVRIALVENEQRLGQAARGGEGDLSMRTVMRTIELGGHQRLTSTSVASSERQ